MERHDDNALIIYTDGSCKNSPRRGGYAFRLVTNDEAGEEVTYDYNPPGSLGATNNEMELKACIEALRLATGRHCPVPESSYEKIVIYTDSMYVLEGVPRAEGAWPRNDWLTRENEPVLSPDLWKELLRLKKRSRRVEFRRVQAHKTNPHNKRVDELAKESANLADRGRAAPRMVGRKSSPRKTEPRVVPMRGQTETIRIIVVRAISGQPHHAYKYEVVGKESPDFGAVDDAFAMNEAAALRRAHVYEVRFSEAGNGRWIEEVLGEVERE